MLRPTGEGHESYASPEKEKSIWWVNDSAGSSYGGTGLGANRSGPFTLLLAVLNGRRKRLAMELETRREK